jgi:hypothetical protein
MGDQVVRFVLMSLASYRLWRLVGYDDVTQPARDRLPERFKISDMVACPWCLGSWIAFAVVATTSRRADVRWPVLQALGAASLVGAIHTEVERGHLEMPIEVSTEVAFSDNDVNRSVVPALRRFIDRRGGDVQSVLGS